MSIDIDERVPPEFFADETDFATQLNDLGWRVRRRYPVYLTFGERELMRISAGKLHTGLIPLHIPEFVGGREGFAPSDIAALLWEIKLKFAGDAVAKKLANV